MYDIVQEFGGIGRYIPPGIEGNGGINPEGWCIEGAGLGITRKYEI